MVRAEIIEFERASHVLVWSLSIFAQNQPSTFAHIEATDSHGIEICSTCVPESEVVIYLPISGFHRAVLAGNACALLSRQRECCRLRSQKWRTMDHSFHALGTSFLRSRSHYGRLDFRQFTTEAMGRKCRKSSTNIDMIDRGSAQATEYWSQLWWCMVSYPVMMVGQHHAQERELNEKTGHPVRTDERVVCPWRSDKPSAPSSRDRLEW